MTSHSSGHSTKYKGKTAKQQDTDTTYEPHYSTNQYNSGTTSYGNTGASTCSFYGTTDNSENYNESNQYYYPTDQYSHSYSYATPSNQRLGNSSGYIAYMNKPSATCNQINSLVGSNLTDNKNTRGYVSLVEFRQYYSNRQQLHIFPPKGNSPPPLFMGKDSSYPTELNALMNPFYCALCDTRLNSIKSSNIHYESKVHDRRITKWLTKTYTANGLTPPKVQRFVTDVFQEAPRVFQCELCKLEFKSAHNALQHFNGKRHRNAASKVSRPTGIGFFNIEGKWVQTGRVIDKISGKETSFILVKTPTGFEPIALQVASNAKKFVNAEQRDHAEEPLAKKLHIDENLENEQEANCRSMLSEIEKPEEQELLTQSVENEQEANCRSMLSEIEKPEEQELETQSVENEREANCRSMLSEIEKPEEQELVTQSVENEQEANCRSMLSEIEKPEEQELVTQSVENEELQEQNLCNLNAPIATVPQIPVETNPAVPDSTSNNEYQSLLLKSQKPTRRLQCPQDALDSLYCKACGITTTSKDQMLMHLKGQRHTRKLRFLGECPMVFESAPATILESLNTNDPFDISMYRTPTGSYYCKMCNFAIAEDFRMKRHILGKKHLVSVKIHVAAELASLERNRAQQNTSSEVQ